MMYQKKWIVGSRQIDIAGDVSCKTLLEQAHIAYEEFLDEVGIPLRDFLMRSPIALPIVHCEVEKKTPIEHRDEILIQVLCDKVGNSSFQLQYQFGDSHAIARTIHVAIDRKTKRKVSIPHEFREQLQTNVCLV